MAITAESVAVLPGALEVFPDEHVVRVRGQIERFTRLEVRVLLYLTLHRDRVISREQLFEFAWEQPLAKGSRSVDVYVRRLRSKLAELFPEWTFIHTHVGIGYRLDPEPTPAPAALGQAPVRHRAA
jgi:DNA-binding response OmpR family regulator